MDEVFGTLQAAETPRWHAEVDANPQLMGPV